MTLVNTLFEHVKNILNDQMNFIVGLVVNEVYQVAAIIEKLPTLWKDFKNYLKHKRKKMTIEDLVVKLRFEEDNKSAKNR